MHGFSKPCIVSHYRCLKLGFCFVFPLFLSRLFIPSPPLRPRLSRRQRAPSLSNKMSPHKMNKSGLGVYQTSYRGLSLAQGRQQKLFTNARCVTLRHAASRCARCVTLPSLLSALVKRSRHLGLQKASGESYISA